MKIYLSTSDNYRHLVQYHALFLNKYYSNADVFVLCYKIPDNIPSNYHIISLGKQSDFWSDPLREYFLGSNENTFIFLLDDLFLIQPVNRIEIENAYNFVNDGYADKVSLENHWKNMDIKNYVNDNFVELLEQTEYRTTLKPSVWNKDLFLEFCKPNFSPWDFELKNMNSSYSYRMFTSLKRIYTAIDIYRRRSFNYKVIYEKKSLGLLNDIDERLIMSLHNSGRI